MEYYTENYCEACSAAVKESREYALREQLDPGAATRTALAQRAHDAHRNKIDPRYPITRADYWNTPLEEKEDSDG